MNRVLLGFLFILISLPANAQIVEQTDSSKLFVIAFVGAIAFFSSYLNSVRLFTWIEDQTYGTRDYVLQKCELLFYEIDPMRVTYILLFLAFGLGSIVMGIFFLMSKFALGVFLGIVTSFIGWRIPRPIMDYLVSKRVTKYEDQVVDALGLLSNGLKAGLSLPQAMGMVVEELPAPVSQEFNLILQQTKIGVPLNEAFDSFAKRMPTEDNEMFVTSVNILRETGGNLAEVFDTIADVVRERVRLKQKVATYLAQGKAQASLISSMPVAMLGYFTSTDPETAHIMFDTVPGMIAMIVALGLTAFGGFVMYKVVQIKV